MEPVSFDLSALSIAELNAMLVSLYRGEHRLHKDYKIIEELKFYRRIAYDKQATFLRQRHLEICHLVREGQIDVTQKLMASIKNPEWKQELIKAICLRKVGG